jgi:hypothetical protein
MRYWVGVASRDHVMGGIAGGFCQFNHGKRGAVSRVKPGDRVIYYSPRTALQGGTPVQAFTALGIVADGEPYEGDMGGGFVPVRRDVRYLAGHDAPIHPLLDHLSFTRGRSSWGYAFRRGLFEITAEDHAVIAAAMGIDARSGETTP